jgi:hypothetical protein
MLGDRARRLNYSNPAVILDNEIKVGDFIQIEGRITSFVQVARSIQAEGKPIATATEGEEIGIKIDERAREDDLVYKIS